MLTLNSWLFIVIVLETDISTIFQTVKFNTIYVTDGHLFSLTFIGKSCPKEIMLKKWNKLQAKDNFPYNLTWYK